MSNSSFFNFHCPLGGQWYACASGSNFVGCCTTDPCANGCVQGNIRPGGYNISHHGEWPDASCGSASDFFTCNAGNTFWGCCKTNPCAATVPATCAQGDLVPAFMERPEQFKTYVGADKQEDPKVPASSTLPEASKAAEAGKSSDSGKSNTGAIVGGVVGGVVVLALIAVIAFVILRRRKNKKPAGGDMGAATMMPMMNNEKNDHSGAAAPFQSPPPTYSAPIQNTYQETSTGKGHESYYQYASHANEPQELPAESAPAHGSRFSELPAGASNVMDNRRFSELPAEG